MKHGENGKGLASRWYPQTLARRVRAIYALRDRISFVEGDGFDLIRQHAEQPTAAFFIDPPYTAGGKSAGRRLYTHSDVDHGLLFDLAATVSGEFLMTYDDSPEVHELACRHGYTVAYVHMMSTHHAKQHELLITRGGAAGRGPVSA